MNHMIRIIKQLYCHFISTCLINLKSFAILVYIKVVKLPLLLQYLSKSFFFLILINETHFTKKKTNFSNRFQ